MCRLSIHKSSSRVRLTLSQYFVCERSIVRYLAALRWKMPNHDAENIVFFLLNIGKPLHTIVCRWLPAKKERIMLTPAVVWKQPGDCQRRIKMQVTLLCIIKAPPVSEEESADNVTTRQYVNFHVAKSGDLAWR